MSGRLVILSLIGVGAVALSLPAAFGSSIAACRAMPDTTARLACYDALPLPRDDTAEFRGAGSGMAGPFEVIGPQVMRFRSDDAIFVAYLLDEGGQVVQNLHHGGAGEGTFLIEHPGTYRVQVNATGGWTITLSVQ